MADQAKFEAARRRLIRGLTKIIAECDAIRADLEWWNNHRTDAQPLDVGGDIVAARLAREALALVEAGKPLPDSLWNRLKEQLEANAHG